MGVGEGTRSENGVCISVLGREMEGIAPTGVAEDGPGSSAGLCKHKTWLRHPCGLRSLTCEPR